jgi:hypothetical protein
MDVYVKRCGLGKRRCEWRAHFISMVRFSILITRTPFGYFNNTRGPSRILYVMVNRGSYEVFWWGQEIMTSALILSQLLFADDTLTFCEANLDHLRHLHLSHLML